MGVLALGTNGTQPYAKSLEYVENSNVNGAGTLDNPRYVHTYHLKIMVNHYYWKALWFWLAVNEEQGSDIGGGGTRGADIWFEGTAFMSLAFYANIIQREQMRLLKKW